MTLRQYLILMSLGTVACAIAWLFIVFSIDPTQAGVIGLTFFYISLFLTLLGAFSVIGFLLRRKLVYDEVAVFRHVRRTFRQSIIFSLFFICVLLLLQKQWFNWWNLALLIFLVLVTEGIIFSNRKNKRYVQ
ncbi:MAG TPA: hypothetical protein VJH75_01365 [Patescibacteria group bacterium]|nr:hypothetical protein [Patescibacteria group bacterium]